MASDPRAAYSARLHQVQADASRLERRHRALGFAKLAVGLATVVLAIWLVKYLPRYIALFLVPAAVFAVLSVVHERVIRARERRARIVAFYQRALVRLDDRWAGTGEQGLRWLEASHPYARDLDIFGEGSLFELLCTARTRAGEQTLARWLLHPAEVTEITERQASVAELSGRLAFRERIAVLGDDVQLGVKPQALSDWGKSPPLRFSPGFLAAAMFLAMAWIASLVLWGWRGWGLVALATSLAALAFTRTYHARVERAVAAIEEAAHDLPLLAGVLAELERGTFATANLIALQTVLRGGEVSASQAIARLNRLVEHLDSRENWIIKAVDPFISWTPQVIWRIERWRAQFGPSHPGLAGSPGRNGSAVVAGHLRL